MYKIKKSNKIILAIIIITMLLIFLLNNASLASVVSVDKTQQVEYSEAYKRWLNLPEDERKKVMMPNMYDIDIETDDSKYLNSINNIFKLNKLLGASVSASDEKFDLRNEIKDNLQIKNQESTGGCWAFAMLAALETHFAREDKENGSTTKEYDFSERHMVYATVREAFGKNVINEKGFTKDVYGGNAYIAQAYMTNGSGAIIESEMPFEDNEDDIDIAQIQNKNVVTTLVDGEILGSPNTETERTAIIQDIKEHISTKGGVWASLHGASLLSNCYNNSTAAIYANNSILYPANHAILIIGWDDTYSKLNFNEKMRPQNDGAWVIKNSWGTEIVEEIPSYVTDEQIEKALKELKEDYGENKVKVIDNKIIVTIGDNGFMYVSYEDVNILESLYKIVEAKNYKDYDNIYQYDYLGVNGYGSLTGTNTKGYLATVFERNSKDEELTKIGFSTLIPYNECRVYVNPNGASKKYDNLQLVDLAEGEYEKLEIGYNTIEFSNPIKITGNSFVVVLELSTDESKKFKFPINMISSNGWENVKIESNKSFVGYEQNVKNDTWLDITDPTEGLNANLTIKAFTNNIKQETLILSNIEIGKAPTKTTYNVGDKFDETGMIVNAIYTNGTKKEVTNYKVTNGESLELNQKSVTISYTENGVTKTTTQKITVNKEITLTKIEVITKPTKLEYIQNKDELNLSGGVIKATYSDETTKNIEMTNSEIKATGYDKTKAGKQIITLTYKGKTTTFEVTVKSSSSDSTEEKTINKIVIKTKPTKIEYTQNKDNLDLTGGIITVTYSDGSTKDILMTDSKVKVTGYDKTKIGKQTITVTYEGKTTTFEITVKEAQKRTPTLSSFKDAKANITKATSYIYIKKDKTEYSTMTINLDGIERGDKDSTRQFFYYLSGKKGETNISNSNWTKLDMNLNDSKYSTNLNIDTRNVKNASEIAKSESLYVYIKEVATLDGNTTETINTINVKKVVDVEVYLDDVKQSDINIGGTNTETSKGDGVDNTTAKNPIPQTGVKTIGIIILAIMGIAIISFVIYKNIDKKIGV